MDRTKRAWWLLLAAAIAVLDLWSKALWTYPERPLGRPRVEKVIWDGVFEIRTIWNTGGVWSLEIPQALLFGVTLLAIPLIVLWLFWPKESSRVETIGKLLVLGGAIGNLYDRWRYEAVRDFIQVYLFGWPYPTFNVADIALVVGIGLLLISGWRKPNPQEAGEHAAK